MFLRPLATAWKYFVFLSPNLSHVIPNLCFHFCSFSPASIKICCLNLILSSNSVEFSSLDSSALSSLYSTHLDLVKKLSLFANLFCAHILNSRWTLFIFLCTRITGFTLAPPFHAISITFRMSLCFSQKVSNLKGLFGGFVYGHSLSNNGTWLEAVAGQCFMSYEAPKYPNVPRANICLVSRTLVLAFYLTMYIFFLAGGTSMRLVSPMKLLKSGMVPKLRTSVVVSCTE